MNKIYQPRVLIGTIDHTETFVGRVRKEIVPPEKDLVLKSLYIGYSERINTAPTTADCIIRVYVGNKIIFQRERTYPSGGTLAVNSSLPDIVDLSATPIPLFSDKLYLEIECPTYALAGGVITLNAYCENRTMGF